MSRSCGPSRRYRERSYVVVDHETPAHVPPAPGAGPAHRHRRRLCLELLESARSGDTLQTEPVQRKLMDTAILYQRGRTLGQSLAALKAAMSIHGLCGPAVLSPLLPLTREETEALEREVLGLGLTSAVMNGASRGGKALFEKP